MLFNVLQVVYNFVFHLCNFNNFIKITGRQDVTDLSGVLQKKIPKLSYKRGNKIERR